MIHSMSLRWNCIYIDTEEGVKELLDDLMQTELAVFDTETADSDTGLPTLVPENCEVILSSFCFSDDVAFVVKGDLIRHLEPWFSSPEHLKIGHNLLFDAKVILFNKYCPMPFRGYYIDTLYLAWLEDCEKEIGKGSLGLKVQLGKNLKGRKNQ